MAPYREAARCRAPEPCNCAHRLFHTRGLSPGSKVACSGKEQVAEGTLGRGSAARGAQRRALHEEVQGHDGADGIHGSRKITACEDDRDTSHGLRGRGRSGEVAVDQRDLVPVPCRAKDVQKVRREHRVHSLQQAQARSRGVERAVRDGQRRRPGQASQVTRGKHRAGGGFGGKARWRQRACSLAGRGREWEHKFDKSILSTYRTSRRLSDVLF
jgi:hypothetical protein